MSRLIHLNGPPGIGKSTLARRYVGDHPDTLNCDIDVLRTFIGGWDQDFLRAGALIRPAALALIGAYLREGHDVVLPQMLIRATELARFESCAVEAGAEFVERFLLDNEVSSVARFHRRGRLEASDPWHHQVREIVAAQGGDTQLRQCHAALTTLAASRPNAVCLSSVEGDQDDTYRRLIETLQ